MREKYKISEVAKIFGISRRTLLYYDEIGLFKPYSNDENGYRYYSEDQIYNLNFIMTLKKSGFSLNEIKRYLDFSSTEESVSFLDDKVNLIKENIKFLESSIKIIQAKKEELKSVSSPEGLNPSILYDLSYRFLSIDVEKPYGNIEVRKAYNKLYETIDNLDLDIEKYIVTVDKKNLERLDFHPVKIVGALIKKNIKHDSLTRLEKSKYATITHKDSFERLEISYKKLIDFIKKNNYKIIGDSIELTNEVKLQLEKGVGEVIQILIPID